MWGRKKQTPSTDPATAGLRDMVLALGPADVGLPPGTDHERVHGVLLEMGHAAAYVTIVSLIDGTTSMYISNGGGTIGAGQHEVVAQASRAFVAAAQQQVAETVPTEDFPPPDVDRTRFHLLTAAGGRTAEAATDDLGHRRHPLAPLFHAGQDVITQIRLLQEAAP